MLGVRGATRRALRKLVIYAKTTSKGIWKGHIAKKVPYGTSIKDRELIARTALKKRGARGHGGRALTSQEKRHKGGDYGNEK